MIGKPDRHDSSCIRGKGGTEAPSPLLIQDECPKEDESAEETPRTARHPAEPVRAPFPGDAPRLPHRNLSQILRIFRLFTVICRYSSVISPDFPPDPIYRS